MDVSELKAGRRYAVIIDYGSEALSLPIAVYEGAHGDLLCFVDAGGQYHERRVLCRACQIRKADPLDQPKEEAKAEAKAEVKEEPKAEAKEEPKEEIKEEPKEEPIPQIEPEAIAPMPEPEKPFAGDPDEAAVPEAKPAAKKPAKKARAQAPAAKDAAPEAGSDAKEDY